MDEEQYLHEVITGCVVNAPHLNRHFTHDIRERRFRVNDCEVHGWPDALGFHKDTLRLFAECLGSWELR